MSIFETKVEQPSGVAHADESETRRGPARSNSSVAARAARARAVQGRGNVKTSDDVLSVAAEGVSGSGGALPHMDKIQASFGTHDVSGISAHTGTEAASAADRMGAQAYATGNAVAFATSSPDLHTAAHEAAHVIQQKAGVQLKGGVGREGDVYERHADAVADRVVAGESAQGLLDDVAGNPAEGTLDQATSVQRMVADFVQFIGRSLETPLRAGEEAPFHGEDAGEQRRYSLEQYIEMWEEEQGRKLTEAEKKTLHRGCIGITALNLTGGGNPPLDNAYGTFEQAHAAMVDMNVMLERARATPETAETSSGKTAILFAKMFWSNQTPDQEDRKMPDDDAFLPDPETGRVDMSSYDYKGQPGYVNFDYAFWDHASQSFWHANHMMPGMKVYQSTQDKFAAGYMDFDRVIYCVAVAQNYDPSLAAEATVEPAPPAPDLDATAEIPRIDLPPPPPPPALDVTTEIPRVEARPPAPDPDVTAELPVIDVVPIAPPPPPAPVVEPAAPVVETGRGVMETRGGTEYVIQPGDTLGTISLRVYGYVGYWRRIMEANADRVHDGGNLIYAGDTLVLPAIEVAREVED